MDNYNFVCKHNFIMKKFKSLLAISISAAVLIACNGNNSAKKDKNVSEITEVSVDQIIEDLENIPTPTAFELMTTINKMGIPYIMDATNSLANQQNYLSSWQKSLNLGVYAADLCYNVAFGKKAESEEYMKCLLLLASDLNISVDAEKISNDFQGNINNIDSLAVLVKDLLSDSQYILNQTSQTETALLFLIGSWIESAHICTVATETSHNVDEMIEVGMKHFEYVDTILKYLESRKESSDFSDIYTQLQTIKTSLETLKEDRTNSDKFDDLSMAINGLRNSIV